MTTALLFIGDVTHSVVREYSVPPQHADVTDPHSRDKFTINSHAPKATTVMVFIS